MSEKKDTNIIGDAGVNKTLARLQVACFANVSAGSYSEDSMKYDMFSPSGARLQRVPTSF